MSIPRVVLAAVLVALGVYVVTAGAAMKSVEPFVVYTAGLALLGMATACVLLPLGRAGGFVFGLALVPVAAFLVQYEKGGASTQIVGVLLLVLIGAGLRGLLRHSVESVADDLHSDDPSARARGIDNLGFLMHDQHGPAMDACQALLDEALGAADPAVRERAEALRARVEARFADPMEALDDLKAEALAEEAMAEDPTVAIDGDAPPPPTLDELMATLRGGKPGPCRDAVEHLVAMGASALPALQAAAEEGDPDLRIDALRAIELIEQGAGSA